jgi:AcrR family transcriptional regulator
LTTVPESRTRLSRPPRTPTPRGRRSAADTSPAQDIDTGRPLRADARRNRARVLAAAQDAFAVAGVSVSLAEIADRAGVGAGTVYRHFPTKEALFEEVVAARIEQLLDETDVNQPDDRDGASFYRFFATWLDQARLNAALCHALESSTGSGFEAPPVLQSRFRDTLAKLLTGAQQAGAVRSDVDASDAIALMVACLAAEQHRADTRSPGRLAEIVSDSLRPQRAHPRMPQTARPDETARNETLLADDETAAPHNESLHPRSCESCDKPIAPSRTGRPARYCSASCRQKAHRNRRSNAVRLMGSGEDMAG